MSGLLDSIVSMVGEKLPFGKVSKEGSNIVISIDENDLRRLFMESMVKGGVKLASDAVNIKIDGNCIKIVLKVV